jgi:hypothetical protein
LGNKIGDKDSNSSIGGISGNSENERLGPLEDCRVSSGAAKSPAYADREVTPTDPGNSPEDFFAPPINAESGVCASIKGPEDEQNDGSAYANCMKCVGGDQTQPTGWWTAIGCISTDMPKTAAALTTFLLGVAGLFFLAQVLYGAFKMVVSRGDPRGVQEARERITNSVMALLFIIFSVTILRFIGVSIFNLPGFFD